jgi:membrane-bound lytic murein transglycosylase F
MIPNKYRLTLIIALVTLVVGATLWVKVTDSVNADSLLLQYEDPVDLDFAAIKERGSIRLITRYSSVSYFLHHGLERGFEYEFLSEFAKLYNLRVEVVIPQENEDPIDVLNRGDGDVIAQNYSITPKRARFIEFSEPYNLVNQVLVLPSHLDGVYSTLDSLNGLNVTVRRGSSYYYTLREIQKLGIDINIELVPENWDTEGLINAVATGDIQATIADDNLYNAAAIYIKGITAGPSLSRSDVIAWGIRRNASELKDKMDEFLSEHFRVSEMDGEPKRSMLLNMLRHRYFENEIMVHRFRSPVAKTEYAGLLSPYDSLVRPIAEDMGVDWKLVVAVMAQESRFDPYAESWAGAVGLMQVIPRFSEFADYELYDEELNIREGIRILKEHLDHYAYLDSTNQIQLALATYNSGMGHIADARRIAIDQNKDPNNWEHVEDGLMKLMHPEFYMNARFGFARGIETSNYVRDVMNRYRMYHTIVTLAQDQEAQRRNGWTFGFNGLSLSR